MDAVDHTEFAELLAVYSLDTLPPDEVSELESHLADCPRCRAELESLRDVAALLGNSGVNAPVRTWDRIASELGLPPADDAVPLLAFQRRKRTPVWRNAALAAAAVVMVVLGLLSYRVVNLDNRVGQLQASLGQRGVGQLVTLAIENPASHDVELTAKTSPREHMSWSCPMALPTGLTTISPRCRQGTLINYGRSLRAKWCPLAC